jgi:LDH2 family malate/lactate/ureidoglycolate dehydrogenase
MSKTLTSAQWQEIARRIFVSWGTPGDIAECVARSLVDADLAGMGSHGVLRIPMYYSFWQQGWFNPQGRPVVVKEGPATASVDGNWGFGQTAMYTVLDVGLAKAYGGAQRVMSTNPLAAGVPAGEHPPFIMDFATSQVAAGKIELAPDQDMPIPEGWALAADGSPARTPRQFMDGGGLLPFGGHKGYAIAMLIEMMCGGLTEGGITERPDHIPTAGLGGNAAFTIVIDVAHFADLGPFQEAVDAFMARLKRVKPSLGSQGVVIPGEPEVAQRAAHAESGITVADATWDKIVSVAEAHKVQLDDALAGAAAA